MKVGLKSKKIIDDKTSSEVLLKILLKNRDIDENFLKEQKTKDLSVVDFGVNKKDFDKVIKIISEAIENKKKIVIYGDYDADGVMATAILWRAIYPLNKNVFPFVPNRETDGYGVKYESFDRFCKKKNLKADLLITVDNGVVAQKEISKIKKDGVMVVVIDHHKKNKEKLKLDGLIHSTKTTASVLAFLTARRMGGVADIDLAAIGLIADCADLSRQTNRTLAIDGLTQIKKGANKGINLLLKMAGVDKSTVTEETVGFVIGPRINAAGRMSDATNALRLVCFDNKQKILEMAKKLNQDNVLRQTIQRQAIEKISNKEYKDKIIVEVGEFHPGLIGLLAGKLADLTKKPAIVVSKLTKMYKGSARSVDGFDITLFLRQDEKLFESLGGHSGAAGFSIKKENFSKWIKSMKRKMKAIDIETDGQVMAEAKMKLSAISLKNYKIVERLRPFGGNNNKPLFLFEKLRVIESRLVGGDRRHLKLRLDDPETEEIEKITTAAIAFNKGFFKKEIDKSKLVNILAYLNLNKWMGKMNVELLVKEIWV